MWYLMSFLEHPSQKNGLTTAIWPFRVFVTFIVVMNNDIIQSSKYKRDISNAFDSLNSSYRCSKRLKPLRKLIRVYTAYSCSTGAMGHLSLFDTGEE